jgi:hypothetical protein
MHRVAAVELVFAAARQPHTSHTDSGVFWDEHMGSTGMPTAA